MLIPTHRRAKSKNTDFWRPWSGWLLQEDPRTPRRRRNCGGIVGDRSITMPTSQGQWLVRRLRTRPLVVGCWPIRDNVAERSISRMIPAHRRSYYHSWSVVINHDEDREGFQTKNTAFLHHRRSKRDFSSSSSLGPATSSLPENSRGLFSIPQLRHPSDFLSLAATAMEDCDRLRQELSNVAGTDPPPRPVLYRLDAISQAVCNVIDAAELARSAHADPAWRDAAHRAFAVLSEYIAQLNSDPSLYQALVQATQQQSPSSNDSSSLTEEERRFAFLLKAEFEKEGIHLQDEPTQIRLRELHSTTTDLESLFLRNLVSAPRSFQADAKAVHDIVPPHVLQEFRQPVSSAGSATVVADLDSSIVELPGEQSLLQSLLKCSPDPVLRRQVYMESVTAVPENLAVLDALVRTRQELAQLLGFASYAEYFLCDKMAGTPQRVLDFLDQLQQQVQPRYSQELLLVSMTKQKVEGSLHVEPWDIPFYIDLIKARNGFDVHTVAQYLQLNRCVQGMQTLVQCLFGIEMKEEPMTDNERWDGNDGNESQKVRRFDFYHDDDSLGTMYLDLHPRPYKYGHAAHFTVRCGCLKDAGSPDERDSYQRPIVALLCNLSATGWDGHLMHGEVETLFHEFGHALHSLLSRTRFQHMSGTRAATDFAETPSTLLENFVWDPQFLPLLARDHHTGEPIPDRLVRQLVDSRYKFSAIERQNQIIYSLFDQKLFGVPEQASLPSTELFDQLHRVRGVPHAAGTHWHSRFGHLVTYGAGYYGYLFSQVFASDIWKTCFDGQSLSRECGDRLWRKMLAHGGAKDPWAMLTDVLGRPPMGL